MFVGLGVGSCLDVDERGKREVVEGMRKRKLLGDDFAKIEGISLFLNCKLLSANYGLYVDWVSERL